MPFLIGQMYEKEFFIRAILSPSLVFFLLFLSSSMTLTCCCSYPKFKTHVQTQPQLLMPVASISSYFGAPSEFGPRCPVELLQETGADGMLREMRGVWLDLEDKGILVI